MCFPAFFPYGDNLSKELSNAIRKNLIGQQIKSAGTMAGYPFYRQRNYIEFARVNARQNPF